MSVWLNPCANASALRVITYSAKPASVNSALAAIDWLIIASIMTADKPSAFNRNFITALPALF